VFVKVGNWNSVDSFNLHDVGDVYLTLLQRWRWDYSEHLVLEV
jgi:hypothetical protein